MALKNFKKLKVEVKNQLQVISLNHPQKRNAFEPEMIKELTKAFQKPDEKARAILLKGEGESFCAGADLEWMKSMAKYTFAENQADSLELFDMFQAVKTCELPVVGQVHGHAFGGALGLIAACDIAAAEASTQFCFSEVKLGLVPAVISPFVTAKIKASKAREWMLTASLFSAGQALDAGFLNFAGTLADVEEFIKKTIHKITQAGPEAVRETKRLLQFLEDHDARDDRQETARVIAERRVSAEGQTGLKAFFAKTKPVWSEKN